MIAKQKPMVVLNRARTRGAVRRHRQRPGHASGRRAPGRARPRRVTYVAGPEASWADGMRWRRCMEAAHELELRVRRVGPVQRADGARRASAPRARSLAQRPTAVIAYNDVMAIGVIKGMRRAGVRVPRRRQRRRLRQHRCSPEIVDPELTTVAAPLRAMGDHRRSRTSSPSSAARRRAVSRSSCRSGSSSAARPLSAAGRGPRRRSGTTSVSGSASKAARSTAAGSR